MFAMIPQNVGWETVQSSLLFPMLENSGSSVSKVFNVVLCKIENDHDDSE